MKQIFAFVLLVFPFTLWAADCPSPEDCYVDRVTYEILDSQGVVVDKTVYERNVPIPYTDAIALKYMRMVRHTEGGAKVFLKVLGAQGKVKDALQADISP